MSFNLTAHPHVGGVRIANGAFIQLVGEGSINVLLKLLLSSALHVSEFSFNLLCINSFTKNRQLLCYLLSIPLYISELENGVDVGAGLENNGLYILEPMEKWSTALQSSIDLGRVSLWHQHLGCMHLRSLFFFFFRFQSNG